MAKQTIGAEVKVEYQSVGEMRKAIKEATGDVIRMQQQFGATSKEALAAAKRVAELKDSVKEASEVADLFDPGNKFKALGNTIQTAASGFAALQGAIGLFGIKSEEVEKQLLKVQSALALSQGLSAIADGAKDFQRLGAIIKDQVVTAFSSLRNAIISTGIGALAVGLGLLIANFEKIKGLLNIGVNPETKKFAETTKQAADASRESLKAFDLEERRLKALGVAESEIIAKKKERIRVTLQALDIELKAQQKVLQETLNNFADSEVQRTGAFGVGGQIWSYLFGTDVKDVDGAQAAVEEIKKQREELNVQLLELDKKSSEIVKKENEDAKKQAESDKQKREERQKQRNAEIDKEIEDIRRRNELQIEAERRLQNEEEKIRQEKEQARQKEADLLNSRFQKQIDQLNAVRQKNEENLAVERAIEQEKRQLYSNTANAFGALADLIGRQTAAGKALAIAQATINTWLGVTEVLRAKTLLPEPLGTINKIVSTASIVASGLTAIRNIVKTPVPGGGGTVPNISAQTPLQPALSPQAQAQVLNANAINNLGNQSLRAYILNADIQNQNQINALLQRNASIG